MKVKINRTVYDVMGHMFPKGKEELFIKKKNGQLYKVSRKMGAVNWVLQKRLKKGVLSDGRPINKIEFLED